MACPTQYDNLIITEPGLSINDLGVVIEAVWEARSKWYNIGLKLGISPGTLDAIKGANQNPDECFTDMIKDWLNNGKPRPTWAAMTEALESRMVGYGDLAKKLVVSHKKC